MQGIICYRATIAYYAVLFIPIFYYTILHPRLAAINKEYFMRKDNTAILTSALL
jgi:hypothetical protein